MYKFCTQPMTKSNKMSYLPVLPKKPDAWHSSMNTKALCLSANSHICLETANRHTHAHSLVTAVRVTISDR